MDTINALFTFGIPALVVGSIVWQFIKKKREVEEVLDDTNNGDMKPAADLPSTEKGLQPAGENKSPSPQVVAKPDPIKQVMTLEQVVDYINNKIDDVPHWFCKGGTGSGKSTFIRLALAYRVARGENFVIMTGKRTSVFEDVPCIGRDELKEGEWLVTYSQVQKTCRELLQELVRRDHIPYNERTFNVLNIVLDDASLLISEVEEAFILVRQVGLLGRELKMRLIIATGSLLVKELGMEGRSDLRDHFAVITYNKRVNGSRETLLRPRYDDSQNIPFDAARVPDLSTRSSMNPSRVWKPVKSQNEELEELNESWDYDEDQKRSKYKKVESGILLPVGGETPDDDGEIFSSAANATKHFSASERQRNDFRVSLSFSDVAKIAASIARNEKQTSVVRSMPGYRADHHESFVAEYTKIKKSVEQ